MDMHVAVQKEGARIHRLDTVSVPALTDIGVQIRQNCFTVISA